MRIMDPAGNCIGMVRQAVMSFLPRSDIYAEENRIDSVRKEFTFLKPKFTPDMNGRTVDGNRYEWDYTIRDASARPVATVSRQILNRTDTYVVDVPDAANVIPALMAAPAISAEEYSRNQEVKTHETFISAARI